MAVTDRNGALGAMDDLPRTLRREREARERAGHAGHAGMSGLGGAAHLSAAPAPASFVPEVTANEHFALSGATVTDIRIPFFRLVMFGFKLVFAAVPALILLITLLWLAGHALMTFFPWLVKVQLLIRVP